MRKSMLLAVMAVCLVLLGWLLGRGISPGTVTGESIFDTGLLVEQIQQLSSLVTTKVDVADVQVTQINGYLGSVKAAILIKGDFLLGVDLSQAKFEKIDPAAKTAVLVLPQPAVTSPRLDQSRTRVFAIDDSGLWLLVPGDGEKTAVINRAYEQAQEYIADAANDPALIERSRHQAGNVLAAFFRAIGWTVTIRWASGGFARPGPSRLGRATSFLDIGLAMHSSGVGTAGKILGVEAFVWATISGTASASGPATLWPKRSLLNRRLMVEHW
jgi:Protein of unknown function (DUF4230)